MPFDPDEYLKSKQGESSFDPDAYLSSKAPKEEISGLEAIGAGASQGMTLGHADEMTAGVGALYDYLGGKFGTRGDISWDDAKATRLKAARDRIDEAERQHPGKFKTAEVTGSIAPAFVGGGGLAAAKGLRGAANAVGGGLAAGSGYSEGEIGSNEHLTDAALGGVLGGGTFGLLKGAGAAVNRAKDSGVGQKVIQGTKDLAGKAGKKILSNLGGVDEDAIGKYLQRPKEITNAREFDEIADDVIGGVDKLKERVIAGSSDAADLIPDNVQFSRGEVAGVLRNMRDRFKDGVTDESEAAYREMGRWLQRLAKEGDEASESMSGRDLKSLIKEVDRSIQRSDKAGEFMTPGHAAKSEFRKSIDTSLKDAAPDYQQAMTKVAADAGALKQVGKMYPRASTATSKIKNSAMNPRARPDERAALEALDNRLGTKLMPEADDRMTRRAFETDKTRGSRNAVRYGSVGAAIGSPLGPFGITSGATTGAMIGGYIDKNGGQITKSILDTYLKAKAGGGPKIPDSLNNLVMRYGPLMQKAGERGEHGLGATHYVLMKNDPEYKKMLVEALTQTDVNLAAKKGPPQ